jgi:hypothetical protein
MRIRDVILSETGWLCRSVGWRAHGGDDRKKYSSLGRKLPFMKSRDEVSGSENDNTTNDAESLTSKEEEFVPTYEIVQQVTAWRWRRSATIHSTD